METDKELKNLNCSNFTISDILTKIIKDNIASNIGSIK